MCARLIVVVLALVGLSQATGQDPEPQMRKSVPILAAWGGYVEGELLPKIPTYILTEAEWRKLWPLLRKDEPMPYINFHDALILLVNSGHPNFASSAPEVDAKGNLVNYPQVTAMEANPNVPRPTKCHYQLALISRNGIKSIAGMPITSK
jgi:hypothetical protein